MSRTKVRINRGKSSFLCAFSAMLSGKYMRVGLHIVFGRAFQRQQGFALAVDEQNFVAAAAYGGGGLLEGYKHFALAVAVGAGHTGDTHISEIDGIGCRRVHSDVSVEEVASRVAV